MCTKTPKVNTPKEKAVQYLRNPFLDGMALSANTGRNSLRTDLPTNATTVKPQVPSQVAPFSGVPGFINSQLYM
jgi:hypothetical protein